MISIGKSFRPYSTWKFSHFFPPNSDGYLKENHQMHQVYCMHLEYKNRIWIMKKDLHYGTMAYHRFMYVLSCRRWIMDYWKNSISAFRCYGHEPLPPNVGRAQHTPLASLLNILYVGIKKRINTSTFHSINQVISDYAIWAWGIFVEFFKLIEITSSSFIRPSDTDTSTHSHNGKLKIHLIRLQPAYCKFMKILKCNGNLISTFF